MVVSSTIGNDRTCFCETLAPLVCYWIKMSAPALTSYHLNLDSFFIIHTRFNSLVHFLIPCFATNHPDCSLRARNDRLWRRQKDYGSSTRKTIQIINTSRGDGRAWSQVRVNWTRELRRSLTPRIKCVKWKVVWEGCTINRSMVVSYERAIVLQFGLCHTFITLFIIKLP